MADPHNFNFFDTAKVLKDYKKRRPENNGVPTTRRILGDRKLLRQTVLARSLLRDEVKNGRVSNRQYRKLMIQGIHRLHFSSGMVNVKASRMYAKHASSGRSSG